MLFCIVSPLKFSLFFIRLLPDLLLRWFYYTDTWKKNQSLINRNRFMKRDGSSGRIRMLYNGALCGSAVRAERTGKFHAGQSLCSNCKFSTAVFALICCYSSFKSISHSSSPHIIKFGNAYPDERTYIRKHSHFNSAITRFTIKQLFQNLT